MRDSDIAISRWRIHILILLHFLPHNLQLNPTFDIPSRNGRNRIVLVHKRRHAPAARRRNVRLHLALRAAAAGLELAESGCRACAIGAGSVAAGWAAGTGQTPGVGEQSRDGFAEGGE